LLGAFLLVIGFSAPQNASCQEVIDPRTGTLTLNEIDLSVPAPPIDLVVERTLSQDGTNWGLMGADWQLNWETTLEMLEPIVILYDSGTRTFFSMSEGDTVYRSATGGKLRFSSTGEAVYTRPDMVRDRFDSEGRLIERNYRNGNTVRLSYDSEGRLYRVDGPRQTYLEFTTDDFGMLTTIKSSAGSQVEYFYRGAQLAEVEAHGASRVEYSYDEGGLLVSIHRPESGLVEFSYDREGRIASRLWEDGGQERYEYDDQNGVYQFTDAGGGITTIEVSTDGRTEQVTDPLGNATTIEIGTDGRVSSITGAYGASTRYTYDWLGRRTRVEKSCCGTTTFEYIGDSQLLSSVTYPSGTRREYTYDYEGNLTGIVEDGTTTFECSYFRDGMPAKVKSEGEFERRFSSSPDGKRRSETNVLGETTRYEYDGRGNLVRTVDAAGGETSYSYDDYGRLSSITDPAGGITRYEYNDRGLLSRVTDPNGGATSYSYDSRGSVISETDPEGRTTAYRYDPMRRVISTTGPDGGVYRYEYDTAGNLTKEINPLGGSVSWTYNEMGKVKSEVDVNGSTWNHDYMIDGKLLGVTGPDGGKRSYVYDPGGRRISESGYSKGAWTNYDGSQVEYEYNDQGLVSTVRYSDGLEATYSYDPEGNLVGISDNRGAGVDYQLDPLGRTIREETAAGVVRIFQYDALGNISRISDNRGGSFEWRYDPRGFVASLKDATGATYGYEYDPVGNLTEKTDPLGHTQSMSYNSAGELVGVTEPSEEKYEYSYDEAGRLESIVFPDGSACVYTYDPLGSIASYTDRSERKTIHAYDVAGNLIRKTLPDGEIISFEYDDLGRMSKKTYSSGKTETFVHDPAGRLVDADNGEFRIQLKYNVNGKLARVEYPTIQKSLKYEYNTAGQLTRLSANEDNWTEYGYDQFGRMNRIKFSEEDVIELGYDSAGRTTEITYPNGVIGRWEYTFTGRVASISYENEKGETIAGWRYSYDSTGNPVEVVDFEGNATTYGYDEAGRLTEESGPYGMRQYGYFEGGDRGLLIEGAESRDTEQEVQVTQYEYDDAGQLRKAGEDAVEFDQDGNLILRRGPEEETRYKYDAANQLTEAVLPGSEEVRFGYSPTGERIWKDGSSGFEYYLTDGTNVIAELSNDYDIEVLYVYGPGIDRPLAMKGGRSNYYYHADALGSVALITDYKGRVKQEYLTDAFGNLLTEDVEFGNPFVFTGREYEPELELYYYRARYYDPSLGRFLSPDPLPGKIDDPQTLNRYVYARNAPTRYTDPFGTAIDDFQLHDPSEFPTIEHYQWYAIDAVRGRGNLPPNLGPAAFGLTNHQYEYLVDLAMQADPGATRSQAAMGLETLLLRAEMAPTSQQGPMGLVRNVERQIQADIADVTRYRWWRDPNRSGIDRGPRLSELESASMNRPGAPGQAGAGQPTLGQTRQRPGATGNRAAAGNRTRVRTPGIPNQPGFLSTTVRPGAVYQGVGAGAAYVGLVANYLSCLEIKSEEECSDELTRTMLNGMVYTAAAGGAVLGTGAAVGATYGAVTGTGLAAGASSGVGIAGAAAGGAGAVTLPALAVGGMMIAVNEYGMHVANRPSREAEMNLVREQFHHIKDPSTLEKHLDDMAGVVENVLALRQQAIDACMEVKSEARSAQTSETQAGEKLNQLRTIVAGIEQASALCAAGAKERYRIDELLPKLDEYSDRVTRELQSLHGRAERCESEAEAKDVEERYEEVKAVAGRLELWANEVRTRNEILKDAQELSERISSSLEHAEQIADEIFRAREMVGGTSSTYGQKYENAVRLRLEYDKQRARLRSRLASFEDALGPAIRMDPYGQKFREIRTNALRAEEIRECTLGSYGPDQRTDQSVQEAAVASIEAEDLIRKARGAAERCSGVSAISNAELQSAEGMVSLALYSLETYADIPDLVAECRSRAATTVADTTSQGYGPGGTEASGVDTSGWAQREGFQWDHSDDYTGWESDADSAGVTDAEAGRGETEPSIGIGDTDPGVGTRTPPYVTPGEGYEGDSQPGADGEGEGPEVRLLGVDQDPSGMGPDWDLSGEDASGDSAGISFDDYLEDWQGEHPDDEWETDESLSGTQTTIRAGSPCAYHIFATGSRMGWASALAAHSVGPADETIIRHLTYAGEHARAAYETSFAPLLAWRNWQSHKSKFDRFASELGRTRNDNFRRQIASSLEMSYGPMAQQLEYQVVGDTRRSGNCDANYTRLGYTLAYAHQSFMIAEEAGDGDVYTSSLRDAISHASSASRALSALERVPTASGDCIEVSDVREMVQSVVRGGDIGNRIATTRRAWDTILERLLALAGETSQISESEPPPERPDVIPPPPVESPQEPIDPGDIVGYWQENWDRSGGKYPEYTYEEYDREPGVLRFVKEGDEYVGYVCFFPTGIGYRTNVEAMRLKKTGPNTYEGGCLHVHASENWHDKYSEAIVNGDEMEAKCSGLQHRYSRVHVEGECGGMTWTECIHKHCSPCRIIETRGTPWGSKACDQCIASKHKLINDCCMDSRPGKVVPIKFIYR
jgi:RHS repeat-associated protein